MLGYVIAPLPPQSVQELKDLIALIIDPKKAGQYLSQIEDASKDLHDQLIAVEAKNDEANDKLKQMAAQDVDLQKREKDVAAQLDAVKQMSANFADREKNISNGETALAQKQKAFESEYAAAMTSAKIKISEAEKAKAEALSSKQKSDDIINEYNDKVEKLKNALGK